MMALDERPTIGERYSSAIESSNLKLSERRSDVDYLIAAALIPDSFGLTLYRLMSEFDAVRGPVDAAKRWTSAQMQLAAELRAQLDHEEDAGRRAKLETTANQIREAAKASLRTEFILVLGTMQTLREARYAIGGFAIDMARRKRTALTDEDVRRLAGRVLDAFLDPLCHYCDGRGFSGGGRHEQSGPMNPCKPCKASGGRRDDIGRNDAERILAGQMLMQMDAELSQIHAGIAAGLRNMRSVKESVIDALHGGRGEIGSISC